MLSICRNARELLCAGRGGFGKVRVDQVNASSANVRLPFRRPRRMACVYIARWIAG